MPPAPHRGPAVDVFNIGGGRCRTCHQRLPGGPTIDVFNFGGGCCQTCRSTPTGAPPSTSSTSVVAAAGLAVSTHRAPPIDVFNFDGGRFLTTSFGTSRGPAVECRVKFKITERGTEELAPPAGSQPLLRWVWGLYRYPEDQVPPHTSSMSR
jgi:hypothetical protein